MRLISSLLGLATLITCLMNTSPAHAETEVRDHRASPAPVAVEQRPHYRRRPGPRLMMPLKLDIGAAGANTVNGFAPGIGAALGIHWASLSPTPTDFDIGVGLFGAVLSAPQARDTMDDNGVAYGGAYLEVGHTLARGSYWRTWASGRGEYVATSAFGEDHTGFGAAGRLSAELYTSGIGIEPNGVFLGTYAIGVYVEAGARDLGGDVGALHVGGGLTFRTPLVFGVR